MDPSIIVFIAMMSMLLVVNTVDGLVRSKKDRKEAASWMKARGTTDIVLAPEHTDEDRAWVSSMLAAVESKVPVLILCSCGYANECAMHCNHGVHPDCTGPSYFELNGIETKIEVKTAKKQEPALFLGSSKDARKPPRGRGSASYEEAFEQRIRAKQRALADKRRREIAASRERRDYYDGSLRNDEVRALYASIRNTQREQNKTFKDLKIPIEHSMQEIERLEKELLQLMRFPQYLVDDRKPGVYTRSLGQQIAALSSTNNSGPR